MNELKGLTAEAEIRELVTDWENIIFEDSEKFYTEKSTIVEDQGDAMLVEKIVASRESENFYCIPYRDPGGDSPYTIKDATGCPSVYQVYPHQITTTIYKKEKQEVSK